MGTATTKTEQLVVARGLVNRLWRWIGRIAPPPPWRDQQTARCKLAPSRAPERSITIT
jgi:hypothetical protein